MFSHHCSCCLQHGKTDHEPGQGRRVSAQYPDGDTSGTQATTSLDNQPTNPGTDQTAACVCTWTFGSRLTGAAHHTLTNSQSAGYIPQNSQTLYVCTLSNATGDVFRRMGRTGVWASRPRCLSAPKISPGSTLHGCPVCSPRVTEMFRV